MFVPEATVHENNSFIFWQNYIRFAWKTLIIFAISESLREQKLPDFFFRFGVLTVYSRHVVTSRFRRMDVRHNEYHLVNYR